MCTRMMASPKRNDQGLRWCSGYLGNGHFTQESNFNKHACYADGLTSYCRNCQRLRREKPIKLNWRRAAARKHNLAPGWEKHFARQAVIQEGKCAICGVHESKLPRALARDHSHIQEQNRGLLCGACNLALERLETWDGWEVRARAYLQKWEEEG